MPATVVRHDIPEAIVGLDILEDKVRLAWQSALLRLTDSQSETTAWRKLGLSRRDHVGIKISTLGGRLSGTRIELVKTIIQSLRQAGISKITVWDKWQRDMEHAGYLPPSHHLDAHITSILPSPPGMSRKAFIDYPLVGNLVPGDLDFLTEYQRDRLRPEKFKDRKRFFDLKNGTSRRSYFAHPLVHTFTQVINVSALNHDNLYGIHGTLVSLALGSVDNTLRFTQGSRSTDEAIGEILDHPILKSKVRLHILDGLRIQFAAGPRQHAEFSRPAGIILLSQDPVALDTVGLELLNEYRKEAQMPPLTPQPGHLAAAAEIGLGEADRSRIQVLR